MSPVLSSGAAGSTQSTAEHRIIGTAAIEATRSRAHRTQRLIVAWATSIPSKIATAAAQIIAVPVVYHAIGPRQFADYAAITAAASLLSFLNLGMGGALVSPLAKCAAAEDRGGEARLIAAALLPLAAISVTVLAIALPLCLGLPCATLFGLAAAGASAHALHLSTAIACIGTLAAVPVSVIDSVRQAYQEVHITNAANLLSNSMLCAGWIVASVLTPSLPAFVAVTVIVPLTSRMVNGALLLYQRPYLVTHRHALTRRDIAVLLGDGTHYVGAIGLGNLLIYQWPLYYVARVLPPAESADFAVFFQLIIITLSFGTSFTLPLWGAIADATARRDHTWTIYAIRKTRIAATLYGLASLLVFGFAADRLLGVWMHRSFHSTGPFRWMSGLYVLLAMWENVHWPIALGLGEMRRAATAVLCRASAFGLSVPFVTGQHETGMMISLSVSVMAITGWYYPTLILRRSAQQTPKC